MDASTSNARVVDGLFSAACKWEGHKIGHILGVLPSHQQSRHGVLEKRKSLLCLVLFGVAVGRRERWQIAG